jgi:hypothetical protein
MSGGIKANGVYGFKMASGGIELLLAMVIYCEAGRQLGHTGVPGEHKGMGASSQVCSDIYDGAAHQRNISMI